MALGQLPVAGGGGAAHMPGMLSSVIGAAQYATGQASGTGITWPSANLMIAVRVFNPQAFTATHWWWGVGSLGGTDSRKAALYDADGNLLDSSAGTLLGTANQIQFVADAVEVPEGDLIIALVQNGTTDRFSTYAPTVNFNESPRILGGVEQASAYATIPNPLAGTFPPTNFDSGWPIFGLIDRHV